MAQPKNRPITLDDIDDKGNVIDKKTKKTRKTKEKTKNITDKTKEKDDTEQKSPAEAKQTVEQQMKNIEEVVEIATEMYKKLKEIVKTNEDFRKLEDKKKLDIFREKLGYKEFMEEFPIVTRYIICMGQFHAKAFRRMLEKIRITVHPPPEKREKGYMEDQWVRRQADYIRYLWEAYQKGPYNTAEANWVWEDSYKKLKGEFDDFRDKYDNISKSTKEEKKKLDADNARDVLKRLSTGKQNISEDEQQIILAVLRDKAVRRRHENSFKQVMQSLLEKREKTPHTASGKGQKSEEEEKKKVVMVETVDAERFDEVPDKYKMDSDTAKNLPIYKDMVN